MTKKHAHVHIPNAGSRAGPHQETELDKRARVNAGILPMVPGVLEIDRHQYPKTPQRVHVGMNPTGGAGGGHLHDYKEPAKSTNPQPTQSLKKKLGLGT